MLRIYFMILTWLVAQTASAQLVGYWNFDDNVDDHSGNENHGELFDAAYVADVPTSIGNGKALLFDDPFQHVHIAADPSLDSSVFTVSYFANDLEQFQQINRMTSRQGDTFETGVDKHFGTDSLSYYSPQAGWNRTDFVAELEEWHHIAYVADGETMTLYVDGNDEFGPEPFTAFPTGYMRIGNRWNDTEGFAGMMDDVSLWNVALSADQISSLADGSKNPLTLEVEPPDLPPVPNYFTVGSSVDSWMQSTESIDGGLNGEWDPSDVDELPDLDTYTLEPLPTSPDAMPHINNAATSLGVEGILADSNVHFYRTTFDLESTDLLSANLQLAVDNGVLVYLNGELVAEEVSFLVDNWNQPLPTLEFDSSGKITVEKFDDAVDQFTDWRVGENEIVLAVRNPNEEADPSGGFAFRLQLELPETVLLPGDFDSNEVVDVVDINLMTEELSKDDRNVLFDLNGDQLVNHQDHRFLLTEILGTWIGDANLDGEFNSSDFVQVFQSGEYEDQLVKNSTWLTGDWNGDQEFNSSDFVSAFQDGGFELGPRPEAVPEPSSNLMCQLSLLVVLLVIRSNRKSRKA